MATTTTPVERKAPNRLHIGGEWVEAATGERFATVNPATDERIAEIAEAEKEGKDVDAVRKQLIDHYEATLANPYVAAERGYIDAVIAPSQTRVQIIRSLRALQKKHARLPAKKHGNIPL